MKALKDIPYNEHCALDVFLPEGIESYPAFIFFHGGGLESGSKCCDYIPSFEKTLTDRGIALVSADYRMYPDAKHPDYIEDSADAVAFIINNKEKYGFSHIFVGGSSAGGYLSQMLCFNAGLLRSRGVNPADIAGYVLDAGQPTAHFNVLREVGVDTRRIIIDERAPLYYVGLEAEYPPMRILVSDNDMENRLEQTELLLGTLKHFGYDMSKVNYSVEHGTHTSYIFDKDEDGSSRYGKMIADYIEGLLS